MPATRRIATIILSAAIVALAAQTANAQAPEKRKVNVATASLGLPYLPLIIAQQRKYFADEGLEVEIAAFAGGSKALQSLMGGSSDVASGAYSNTLTMAAKGHVWTAPAVQEELTFQRSVRVQPCIRPVFAWRITSVAMQPQWPLALM